VIFFHIKKPAQIGKFWGRNPKRRKSRKIKKNKKMNKKIIAYILIGLGALDLIIWALNGFSFGWLELVVGVNVLSQYGAWIMIAFGIWMIQKEKAKSKSEIDAIADLNEGENIIFKNIGNSSIVTVTNQKIIFRTFNIDDTLLKNHNNVVADEKIIFEYNDIESARFVKTKETAKTSIGGALNLEFGVQLKMKDGTIHNLPTSKSEIISAHIHKYLNK
jgi:hypothetical protein